MTNEERSAKYLEAASHVAEHGGFVIDAWERDDDRPILHREWHAVFASAFTVGDYVEVIPLTLCFAAAMAEAGDL